MELAQKEGMVPVGFELKQIKARQWVGDVGTAFTLAGLDQANFLSCCDLRLVTSAKYPDKVGAANVYAEVHGMKKAPAKRELLKKLEPVLRAGKAGMKLKAIAEEEGDDDADL
jgi:hypothetical protein